MNFEKLIVAPESEPIKDPLLEQFNHPESIEIDGESFDVVDITPEKLKTKIPTIIVPGFSATPEALKNLILDTAGAERRVISAYAPHGIKTDKEHPDLPDAEMRKLELLLKLIEIKGLEKMNIIANSEASIYVTAAAVLYPEKFENIVLIDPAGLIGKDSTLQLLKRVVDDTKTEGKLKKTFQNGVGISKYPSPRSVGVKSILSNPSASFQEIQAIANSDITQALEEIHKNGIGVSIIHGADDKMFPMDKVQQMVKGNMVDGFYSVWGSHNSIYQYDPFGQAAEAALTALENKKSGQQAKK